MEMRDIGSFSHMSTANEETDQYPAALSFIQSFPSREEIGETITRTIAEKPDNFFYMFQRYADLRRNSMSGTLGRWSDRKDTESIDEERGNCDDDSTATEYYTSSREKPPEIDKTNFLLEFIQSLPLGDILEQNKLYDNVPGIQETKSGPMRRKHQQKQENLKQSLEFRLEESERSSAEIYQKLEIVEQRRQEENEMNAETIEYLKKELATQERKHQEQVRKLEQRLAEAENSDYSHDNNRNHIQLQSRIDGLEEALKGMGEENHDLEAELEARNNSYKLQMNSATEKIRMLEKQVAESRMFFEGEKGRSKHILLEAIGGRSDRHRVEAYAERVAELEASDGRNRKLLEAERRKSETLEKLNQKLKAATEKLSVKASLVNESRLQISNLIKEIEWRDSMISAVKTIVNTEDETMPAKEKLAHTKSDTVKKRSLSLKEPRSRREAVVSRHKRGSNPLSSSNDRSHRLNKQREQEYKEKLLWDGDEEEERETFFG